MYCVINQFSQIVVDRIPLGFVTEYEWLLDNVGQASTSDYQRKYRNYWGMNSAQLGPAFYLAYFDALNGASRVSPTLSDVVRALYDASTRRDGRRTLQFSFATKLLHMTNPQLPIYDSLVAAFYFFQPSPSLEQRLGSLVAFHNFLIQEYARVLKGGHLKVAIQAFRDQLRPRRFTDERIIDSLIWQFVNLLGKGALLKNDIIYS